MIRIKGICSICCKRYLRSMRSKQQQKSELNHLKQNCSTPIALPLA